jgi:hypothetical protein
MLSDEIRNKLENIVNGIVIEEQGHSCTTIRNTPCSSLSTSTTVKKVFEGKAIIKVEQARFLKQLDSDQNFWIQNLPSENNYLTKGDESKAYLHTIIKTGQN